MEDIKDRGSTQNDYLCHMFPDIMTSTNVIFREFIQREKDKWDTGLTTTSNELSNFDRNKFNNMVATTEWSKYDPKDAVIADLTTRVHNLEGVRYCSGGVTPTKTTTTSLSGQRSSEDVPRCPGLAKW